MAIFNSYVKLPEGTVFLPQFFLAPNNNNNGGRTTYVTILRSLVTINCPEMMGV